MNIGRAMKNVGSAATNTAIGKAQRVAIGATKPQTIMRAPKAMPVAKRRIHPGSSAGLKAERTVRLESNTAGYANKANQRARYKQRPPMDKSYQITTSLGFSRQSRTFDTRVYGNQNGSVGLLKERL